MEAAGLRMCGEWDAPAVDAAQTFAYSTHSPAWVNGQVGVPRHQSPADGSGIVAVVLAVMLAIALNIRGIRRMLSTMPQDLFSMRHRANAFEEHTSNETRLLLLLLLQLCVLEGTLLYCGFYGSGAPDLGLMLTLSGLCAAYYLFQFSSCIIVGYAFADPMTTMLWRRGFNASQALLGFALLAPTLIALFYPSVVTAMLVVGAIFYVIARICVIVKGFMIFYHNFGSLLYFILYLCTLEIIPAMVTLQLAYNICVKQQ